jgi:hypothetical protein
LSNFLFRPFPKRRRQSIIADWRMLNHPSIFRHRNLVYWRFCPVHLLALTLGALAADLNACSTSVRI